MYMIIDLNANRFVSMWEDEDDAEIMVEYLKKIHQTDFTIGFVPTNKSMDEIVATIWEDVETNNN